MTADTLFPEACDEMASLKRMEARHSFPPNPSYATEDLVRRSEDMLDSFAAEFPVAPGRYIDLCCGHGGMAYCLKRRGATAVLGVDRCAEPGSRFAQPPVEGLSFLSCDVHHIPSVPPHSIDGATLINSLQYLDTKKFLLEMARLLRPGGRLLIQAGPLYYSERGGGIYGDLATPFVHLLFSPVVIREALGRIPRYLVEINMLTLREFLELCRLFQFRILRLDRRVRKMPQSLFEGFPWLAERYPTEDLELEGFNCALEYMGGVFQDEPSPPGAARAPSGLAASPPQPLRTYMLQLLKVLSSMTPGRACRIAVYGAGAHTEWLAGILRGAAAGTPMPEIVSVLDDAPDPDRRFWGLPPAKPESLDPSTVDAVLISTDRPVGDAMADKARRLWGGSPPVIAPYAGFRHGPYPKDG